MLSLFFSSLFEEKLEFWHCGLIRRIIGFYGIKFICYYYTAPGRYG